MSTLHKENRDFSERYAVIIKAQQSKWKPRIWWWILRMVTKRTLLVGCITRSFFVPKWDINTEIFWRQLYQIWMFVKKEKFANIVVIFYRGSAAIVHQAFTILAPVKYMSIFQENISITTRRSKKYNVIKCFLVHPIFLCVFHFLFLYFIYLQNFNLLHMFTSNKLWTIKNRPVRSWIWFIRTLLWGIIFKLSRHT